jgi:hypothetical protein
LRYTRFEDRGRTHFKEAAVRIWALDFVLRLAVPADEALGRQSSCRLHRAFGEQSGCDESRRDAASRPHVMQPAVLPSPIADSLRHEDSHNLMTAQ